MKSKIQKDYVNNLEKLKYLFGSAYRFLNKIGNNEIKGFWISTAQNVHLYYFDAYYMYIKLSIGKIELQLEFNQRIDASTKDRSNLIFLEPIRKLIISLNGFNEGWAKIEGMSNIVLTSKTPDSFFDGIIDLIQKSIKN
jgi:hypothetical protein